MTSQTTKTKPDSEATVEAQVMEEGLGSQVVVPGLGNTTRFFARVGPSSTPGFRLTITGLSLTTSYPTVVLIEARQGPNENQEFGFPDEFAVQVIRTTTNSILCRILRIDTNSGWGQNLHISALIVD
jgi:hypothetical protein